MKARVTVVSRDVQSGWFFDETLEDDIEFDLVTALSERVASDGSALEEVDLLSVLFHELGHVLGGEHIAEEHRVMHESIDLSTRHQPIALDAAAINALWDEYGDQGRWRRR